MTISVQSLSRVQLFATPWITARQASLSITNSLKLPSPPQNIISRHLNILKWFCLASKCFHLKMLTFKSVTQRVDEKSCSSNLVQGMSVSMLSKMYLNEIDSWFQASKWSFRDMKLTLSLSLWVIQVTQEKNWPDSMFPVTQPGCRF